MIVFMGAVSGCTGQSMTPTISEVTNNELVRALNDLELLAEDNSAYSSVRIYRIHNGTASLGEPSSEVSHTLFIAVSEMDDAPTQRLFKYGPLLNPNFKEWSSKDYEKVFMITSGPANEEFVTTLRINLEELIVVQ